MQATQPGILADNPPLARHLMFSVENPLAIAGCLHELAQIIDGEQVVVGLGPSAVAALGKQIEGLRAFQPLSAGGIDVPSTQAALWCYLRGSDRGELFHISRLLESLLQPAFQLSEATDCFLFDGNRDLSGYEDGTENPQGDEAVAAAIVSNRGAGLDGSSFVAVQQWLHDFDSFDAMDNETQDDVIGRHIGDNEEFDEAPESAHVKRSAQESFSPEAFMLRRSMPWASDMSGGLMFVAFGHSLDAFDAIMNRMAGLEDGIPDALFSFTHPLTGSCFWCPPMDGDVLDLSAIGL